MSNNIGEGNDPWGGYRAGFAGSTSITLADYSMPHVVAKAPLQLMLEVKGTGPWERAGAD